jgi:hypothetical protein
MDHALVRNVRYADAATPRCTHTLANHDIPCGHAIAVFQRFRPLAPSPQRKPRDYTLQPRRCYDGCGLLSVSTAYRCGHLADTSWGSCSVGVSAAAVQESEGAALGRSPYSCEQRGRRAAWRGLYLWSRSGAAEVEPVSAGGA